MKFLLSFFLLLDPIATIAQPLEISGKVTEQDSYLPLPGVSVEAMHRNRQTTTNIEGAFRLTGIYIGDTLLISHIGYTSRRIVIHRGIQSLSIALAPDSKTIEPLVLSTGFEKLPKERATGSFTQVSRALFNEQVGTDVLSRLAVISNGVTTIPAAVPGGPQDALIIRGISSLTMRLVKPLVIIDNFPYQGDLNNINPNDIEDITFLKDAAAGSVWGARAANGVIVITTRKGRFEQRTKAEFVSNMTITPKPDLLSLHTINSSDFIELEKYLFEQQHRFYDTSNVYAPFSPVFEILFRARNGEISQQQATAQIDALRGQDLRKSYLDNMYRNAINQQYAFNIRGGSQSLAWIVTGGLDKNLDNHLSRYNRMTLRLDQIYRPVKNIELSFGVVYTTNKRQTGRPAYGSIVASNGDIPPYTSFIDTDGSPAPLYTTYRQAFIDSFGNGRLLNWQYFPASDYNHITDETNIQDIHAVAGINYRITPWLNAEVKYRYEQQQSDGKHIYGSESYFTRNLVNLFSQWGGGDEITFVVPKGDILDVTNTSITARNIRAQMNANKSWQKHAVHALAGAEQSETGSKGQRFRTYGYNPEVLTLSHVNYTNLYPDIIYGAYNLIPSNQGFSGTDIRFVSFYGNAAYIFDDRYSISTSLRRDASNLFGLKTNDKWTPLWSTGAAWHISNEKFYRGRLLPHLKLRMTYGEQGNVDPSMVAVTTLRYTGVNVFTNTPIGQVENFANPQLRWEKTKMFNLALDFSIKNERINGSVEWYHKRMVDLYGGSIIDLTAGLGTDYITRNIGNMKGTGMDIQFRTVNITRPLLWSSDLIINSYDDKVTKLYETPVEGYLIAGSGLQALEGYPVFSYFAYRWGGLDEENGNPQGYIRDNISTDYNAIVYETPTSELQYIGRLLPRFFGSLGNTFNYKGFSLSARISYKFGYWFKRQSVNYSSLINRGSGHSDYSLRWQQKGDEKETEVPSFTYPINEAREVFYSNAAVLATRGDHIRFQYLNLSYTINNKNKKTGTIPESLRIYVVASQLGILWRANKLGLDPDYNQMAPSPGFSIGVNANF